MSMDDKGDGSDRVLRVHQSVCFARPKSNVLTNLTNIFFFFFFFCQTILQQSNHPKVATVD
jgi:preprotein translocase subunit SecG